jgi:hypothetical protein
MVVQYCTGKFYRMAKADMIGRGLVYFFDFRTREFALNPGFVTSVFSSEGQPLSFYSPWFRAYQFQVDCFAFFVVAVIALDTKFFSCD